MLLIHGIKAIKTMFNVFQYCYNNIIIVTVIILEFLSAEFVHLVKHRFKVSVKHWLILVGFHVRVSIFHLQVFFWNSVKVSIWYRVPNDRTEVLWWVFSIALNANRSYVKVMLISQIIRASRIFKNTKNTLWQTLCSDITELFAS